LRILVTGATGQLGDDVARLARAAGHVVLAPARHLLEPLDATLDDTPFDALVHCAAYTGVDAAESDANAAFAVNARLPGRLAAVCADRGAAFILPGTDYVFDGRARRPYREDDPTAPLNVYGASKLEGERRARAAHPDGTLILRTASLFGLAGKRRAEAGRGGNFVETVLRVAGRGEPLRVVDDIVMSPTATADVARTILAFLRAGTPAGIYHVAGAGEASWFGFARAILEEAGIGTALEPVTAAEFGAPAERPAYSVLDPARAVVAGHEPRPWREAVRAYLADRSRTS
jgi:dTDP-4-dehydrorhamnose reductase